MPSAGFLISGRVNDFTQMARRSSSSPVKLGDVGYWGFFSLNSSNVPTAPDSTPTWAIYTGPNLASATSLRTGTASAITGITGGYVATDTCSGGNGFASGTVYHLLISYAISSTQFRVMIDFLVA